MYHDKMEVNIFHGKMEVSMSNDKMEVNMFHDKMKVKLQAFNKLIPVKIFHEWSSRMKNDKTRY